ncbi:MAG: hypothetical protein VKS61_02105 [Candidatus Sericytochromatia bacterium]|nr:hypothetical protein [Candidatus Sericytochromatia bacterium]
MTTPIEGPAPVNPPRVGAATPAPPPLAGAAAASAGPAQGQDVHAPSPTARDRLTLALAQASPTQPCYDVQDRRISNVLVVDMPDVPPEAVVARLKQGNWGAFWPGAAMSALRVERAEPWAATFDFQPNHHDANGNKTEKPFTIHERIAEGQTTVGPDGLTTQRLDITMSGAFEGKGHYLFTRLPEGGTRVTAVWEGVKAPPELSDETLQGPFEGYHLQPFKDAFTALNGQLREAPRPDAQALAARADRGFAALEQLLPTRSDAPTP